MLQLGQQCIDSDIYPELHMQPPINVITIVNDKSLRHKYRSYSQHVADLSQRKENDLQQLLGDTIEAALTHKSTICA